MLYQCLSQVQHEKDSGPALKRVVLIQNKIFIDATGLDQSDLSQALSATRDVTSNEYFILYQFDAFRCSTSVFLKYNMRKMMVQHQNSSYQSEIKYVTSLVRVMHFGHALLAGRAT